MLERMFFRHFDIVHYTRAAKRGMLPVKHLLYSSLSLHSHMDFVPPSIVDLKLNGRFGVIARRQKAWLRMRQHRLA